MEEVYLDGNTVFAGQQNKGDELLHVRFYKKPKLNKLKSEGGEIVLRSSHEPIIARLKKEAEESGAFGVEVIETRHETILRITGAGRPIYDMVEYVHVRSPADKYVERDQPVDPKDKIRFPRQYAIFKQNAAAEQTSGTPLDRWPLMEAHVAEELKHVNVFTVEQLAGVPDGNLANFRHLTAYKQKANDYLAAAKGQAPMLQMRAAMDAKDEKIDAMARRLDQYEARLSQPQSDAPKRVRNRKPKETAHVE